MQRESKEIALSKIDKIKSWFLLSFAEGRNRVMSKNIVMQELTANRYEELYPKTNTQEIISSNTIINQFLGGGESLEDALGYLAGLNQHWWLKKSEENVYGLNVTRINPSSGKYQPLMYISNRQSLSYKYGDIQVNQKTGEIYFSSFDTYTDTNVNVQNYEWGLGTNEGTLPLGKVVQLYDSYYSAYGDTRGLSYIATEGAICVYKNTSGKNWGANKYTSQVIGTQPTYSYVSSSNPSAYPDNGATQDNAQYWYIGQPFTYLPRLGKVEVGSYIGTGSGNVTLTFENTPQFVHIQRNSNDQYLETGFWINPRPSLTGIIKTYSQQNISCVLSGKTLSYLNQSILNESNITYNVFAITQ